MIAEVVKSAKYSILSFVFVSVAAIVAAPVWPGSSFDWLIFNFAFLMILVLGFLGPQSHVYTFFSLFLFFGFWGKMIFHLVFAIQLIEPVGDFDDSVGAWEFVVRAATVSAVGVAFARLGQILFFSGSKASKSIREEVPCFYAQRRISWWLTALALMALVHSWNQYASFYQIGVNPQLVLPMHLNVIMAWLINWGFAFVFAILAYWELLLSKKNDVLVIVLLFFVALFAGVSTLSRSAYLFQGAAFFLAWYLMLRQRERLRSILWALSFFVFGFAVSIVLVQQQRAGKFLDRVSIESATDTKAGALNDHPKKILAEQKRADLDQFISQLPHLVVGRWIGLEALMAVSAYPDKGIGALRKAIFDDPRLGVSSFFQRVAKSKYAESRKFTFLTLAGPVALVSFSGSLLIIGLILFFLTSLLLFFEMVIRRRVGNPFVICLAGVAMAYTVSQATFLYLTLIFFILLVSTVALIWFLQYFSSNKSHRCD